MPFLSPADPTLAEQTEIALLRAQLAASERANVHLRNENATLHALPAAGISESETARVVQMQYDFVSLMGHELQTPLTSVCGALDLLLEGILGTVTDEQREFLLIARANGQRLTDMANTMLDIWQIEAGGVQCVMEAFEIGDAITHVVGELQPIFSKHTVTCTLRFAHDAPPPLVYGDSHRVMQILRHLLTNACTFNTVGGRVDVRVAVEGAHLAIAVCDSGVGVSAAVRQSVGQPFFCADTSRTRRNGGIGLGLPLVRALVEMHGGALTVDSTPGVGSTFRFTLPIYEG